MNRTTEGVPEPWSCRRCGFQLEFCKCVDVAVLEAERAERDVERKAWTRLVRATVSQLVSAARGDFPEQEEIEREWAARDADAEPKQALRDLGVDVDSLLEER